MYMKLVFTFLEEKAFENRKFFDSFPTWELSSKSSGKTLGGIWASWWRTVGPLRWVAYRRWNAAAHFGQLPRSSIRRLPQPTEQHHQWDVEQQHQLIYFQKKIALPSYLTIVVENYIFLTNYCRNLPYYCLLHKRNDCYNVY